MAARTGLFVAPLPGATPAGTSPTDGRLVLGAAFGTTGGCLSGGALSSSTSSMQITVGQAVWRVPDPTNAAAVFLAPADPYTFTLAAGPASGSRIDVLWVKQDNYENGDADSRVTYGISQGTAAASPANPGVPAGCMAIATVTVPQGAGNSAACTVAASYPGQSIALPPRLVDTASHLPATGDFRDQRGIALDTGWEYRWNGSSWVLDRGDGTNGIGYAGTITSAASPDGTSVQRTGSLCVLNLALTWGGTVQNGGTLIQLPAGFQPLYKVRANLPAWTGSAWVTGGHLIRIETSGLVYIEVVASGASGSSAGVFGSMSFIVPS